jgi:formylglycine-generating enzyme required for sulfatase activity
VGNTGNTGELSGEAAGGLGPTRISGAVNYPYSIGTYEVTAGQYTEFLNAVAATDTYGLYSESMYLSPAGCKIQRSGTSGSYTYSVAMEWKNRPVNSVSWGDAARFANWMQNGQPRDAQGPSTTEDGSYYLNGAFSDDQLLAVTRKPDATWVIPSEDDWYKAAYYDPGLNVGAGGYYDYPTGSNTEPSNVLNVPDDGNNANFYAGGGDYTIDSPYYRTEFGEFENSQSPYGTFDQAGNLWEWTEAILDGSSRGLRGGSFSSFAYSLRAADRYSGNPTGEFINVGFRVASVPEPNTAVLAIVGLLCGLWWSRRRVSHSPQPAPGGDAAKAGFAGDHRPTRNNPARCPPST